MTDTQLPQEFEALAERLDIEVSRENLEGRPGGFCVIRGRRRMILDRGLDVVTQMDLFARAFSGIPLDGLYLVPRLREYIEAFRETEV